MTGGGPKRGGRVEGEVGGCAMGVVGISGDVGDEGWNRGQVVVGWLVSGEAGGGVVGVIDGNGLNFSCISL